MTLVPWHGAIGMLIFVLVSIVLFHVVMAILVNHTEKAKQERKRQNLLDKTKNL